MAFDGQIGTLIDPIADRQWDRKEIRRQVAKRVGGYLARGFAPGDRVVIHFGNRLEFFAELLAIWHLGGCAIPTDSRLTAFEVGKLLRAADARYSVIDDGIDSTAFSGLSDTTLLHTLEHEEQFSSMPVSGVHPTFDDEALILFTSGSTGKPKGVVHTHRSLHTRWMSLRHHLDLGDFHRSLCIVPTHFVLGLTSNCLFPWLSGCDLFVAPPFSTSLIMQLGDLIDSHRISFVSTVPPMWNLALKAAKPPANRSLKRVHVSSAPLSKELWEEIQQWTDIQAVCNVYGATEVGSWVAGTSGSAVTPESGLVGQPWGSKFKILRTDESTGAVDQGAECARGESGVLWVSTPSLMKGYFRSRDLTEAVVSQGWFMTGDIGMIDDQGRLYLKGRQRDEINKGGIKIYPADIDEVVGQFEATRDVCTFRYEDDMYGENIGIAVVLSDRGLKSIQDLQVWVKSHLATHKHPVRWYLLDEIPRTSRGKLNRDAVMQSCATDTPLDLLEISRQVSSGQLS
jgi:long-chain acyl-CoA synthetase